MKKIEAIISLAKLDAAGAQLQRSGIYSPLILTQVERINGFRLREGECAESPQGRLKVELIVGERQAANCCSTGKDLNNLRAVAGLG
jgi:hypothetical protein